MEVLNLLSESVQKGDVKKAIEYTKIALNSNITPQKIFENGLNIGMEILGKKFKNNEIYVPEVLIAAIAMNKVIDILEPELVKNVNEENGKIVIGTVKGDLHDIGKHLLSIMFKGNGFKVIDLGVNVSSKVFLEAIKKYKPDIVGISDLLTSTMIYMKETVEDLKSSKVFDIGQYEEYAGECDKRYADFLNKRDGIAVWQRVRASEVFRDACSDMKESLKWQLGSLQRSLNYLTDAPPRHI